MFLNRFAIDNHTGAVTVAKAKLDYETRRDYQLTVEATDTGGRRDSALLTITLLDVNDNAPEFRRTEYQAFVKENHPDFDTEIKITVICSLFFLSRYGWNSSHCHLRNV